VDGCRPLVAGKVHAHRQFQLARRPTFELGASVNYRGSEKGRRVGVYKEPGFRFVPRERERRVGVYEDAPESVRAREGRFRVYEEAPCLGITKLSP